MMMMVMLIRVIWVHSGRGSRRVTASPALPNCDLDHYQDGDDHHVMIKWQNWVMMHTYMPNHTLHTATYQTNPTIQYETYVYDTYTKPKLIHSLFQNWVMHILVWIFDICPSYIPSQWSYYTTKPYHTNYAILYHAMSCHTIPTLIHSLFQKAKGWVMHIDASYYGYLRSLPSSAMHQLHH